MLWFLSVDKISSSMAGNWLQIKACQLRRSSTQLAGFLLLMMVVVAVSQLWFGAWALNVAGVFAWLAMLLLFSRLQKIQAVQSVLLIAVGLLCALWAGARGVELDLYKILSSNTALVALLAGVSFLRLVTLPASEMDGQALPQGRGAFLKTLIGTHLFSTVINLSALLLVADRLQHQGRLKRETAISLTRAFTAAAFWSPFFAAMGVALTYAPGASLGTLVLQGIPLAMFALWYTYRDVKNRADMTFFQGYPIHFSSLWIPSVLLLIVLTIHEFRPNYSVILVVAALSLLLPLVMALISSLLLSRNSAGGAAFSDFTRHSLHELPKMSAELSLFLSAGVLAAGLNSLVLSYQDALSLSAFSYPLAVDLLILMVLLAVVGIHPVISITIAGTLLAPLDANANIVGLLFLSAWAIGVSVAPLSGMNLALMGRYSLKSRQVFSWHWQYALVMLSVCSVYLWVLMQ
jgi:hypothetical protein